jgi:Ala-tRNA(Pro) deacylase
VSTYSKILSLLDSEGCQYELISHPPAGETVAASRIRGHELCEAAKSLVLEAIERESANRKYYLAVVPGDRKVDLKFLRGVFNVKRVQFASESKARELTGCVMGAVPPFTFHEALKVVLDMAIMESERVVFNAGKLDLSIAMKTDDFLKLVGSKEGYYARNRVAMEKT